MTIEDGEVYTYRDNGLPIFKEFVISWRKKKKLAYKVGKKDGLKN